MARQIARKPAASPSAGPAIPENSVHNAYARHLTLDHVVPLASASNRERFEAVAQAVRDRIVERWLATDAAYARERPKYVYYLSMEFLIGRSLSNNLINLGVPGLTREGFEFEDGPQWQALLDCEPDAGLGNGGLGRLAACFIESLATLHIPAIGYGLRYEYGMFRQNIKNGHQEEQPDHWLKEPDPWEIARPREAVSIPLGCSFELDGGVLRVVPGRPMRLLGIPYDRPVVGYGGKTVNTLRLWEAKAAEFFDFGEFNSGDFVGAIVHRILAETVTRVLYPDDSTAAGQALRFVQEYFLVCCSLQDIVHRFRQTRDDLRQLPEHAALQLNDTHPALAVAELMRVLLDEGGLEWDEAWDATVRSLAYTNHTLLPEALEKWPIRFLELICPRLLEIIYEINRRFIDQVRDRFPDDLNRVKRMSLIEEGPARQVRMAHLAMVGTHSTNGVARIHTHLLRTRVVADFAELFPDRFNNKTNGVTPRRWLLHAAPDLARVITDAIGDGWVTDLTQLRRLLPLADDASFRSQFRQAKQIAKERFCSWAKATHGIELDPYSIFDSQIKRIHEYKRQLLNVLHIIVLYNRLRTTPDLKLPARTFLFAGKAAPAYRLAKLIIKLINNVSDIVERDPATRGRLKVVFLPNYNVTLAERLIPATDVSEQISTAGYEASGTGNMKFMMNGALTIGTRDGATIEMAEEAGEENFFLFGLTAEQVERSRGWYQPRWHYEHDAEARSALDLIFNDHFSCGEPGLFTPLRETLLDRGDYYMHLADLDAYQRAHQELGVQFLDQNTWFRKAVINVACSGTFSSDRSIRDYAAEIWNVRPCLPG